MRRGPWIVRHDDDQNPTTWIASWEVASGPIIPCEAEWSSRECDAVGFPTRKVAALVAACCGGRPVRRRAKGGRTK